MSKISALRTNTLLHLGHHQQHINALPKRRQQTQQKTDGYTPRHQYIISATYAETSPFITRNTRHILTVPSQQSD